MKTKIVKAKIARELVAKLNASLAAVTTSLSSYTRGRASLPETWEEPLMEILECSTRDELKAIFPAIRFAGELVSPLAPLKDRRVSAVGRRYNVEVRIVKSSGLVHEADLTPIYLLLDEMKKIGVELQLLITSEL